MIWVLLVDDQPLTRTGFGTILEAEPSIGAAGEASDGTRGVGLALELCPDVVCMGVQTPRINRTKAARELTSRGYGSAVLILTTLDRDNFLLETLQVGASEFLLKTMEAKRLIEAVQILECGEGLLSLQITRRIIERFTASRQGPHCPGGVMTGVLAEREHDTLLHPTCGLSNTEVAAEMLVSPETVKIHVPSILTKLGLRDRINAVIWAYENGPMPRSS